MNHPYVTVLGATGKVGSQVIRYLSAQKVYCKAVTRDLTKIRDLPYIEWIEADLNDVSQLPKLLTGTNKLFLNSGVVQNMVEVQNNIIDAAGSAGVTHIIKLSTPAARQHSKDPVGEWHWQIEEHLMNSGIKWNILQPQSFMQNWFGDLAATIRSERKIYSTAGDGKRAFTDTRDLGRITAALFKSPEKWTNKILPILGAELVSFYDIAKAFTKVIGEKITYIPQTAEEARVRLKKAGIPDFLIQLTLTVEANQKSGIAEQLLTDNIEQILGSKPFTVRDFAEEYISLFK